MASPSQVYRAFYASSPGVRMETILNLLLQSRIGMPVNPYRKPLPTFSRQGTYTLQDAPSFARRDNVELSENFGAQRKRFPEKRFVMCFFILNFI